MTGKTSNQIAEDFECRIQNLLKTMGFGDVNGGREFKLGAQIDACGGHEDTLIIVECKTTQKEKNRSLILLELNAERSARLNQLSIRSFIFKI